MGRCIAKLGKDQYMCWSSVVDAPVSHILTKKEMIDFMVEEASQRAKEDAEKSIAKADEQGTSSFYRESLEELIASNRAGERESCLTLDEIKKQYRKPKKKGK